LLNVQAPFRFLPLSVPDKAEFRVAKATVLCHKSTMNFTKVSQSRYLCLAALFISIIASRAQEHSTFPVGDFTFTRPAKWEWADSTSQMRKAQLNVTDVASKASANVAFYYFGAGGAGGVQANVDRWLDQFAEPRDQINANVEHTTVGTTKLTYVQAEGTYKSGMPGGPTTPMPGYALIGAILESANGNVFVRMTGPKGLERLPK
jgi:hypothetical protein